MTGKELLEKRLTLALPQKEMADRMKISLATYTRLEQNKNKDMPRRYEPAVELIENHRLKEFSKEDLKSQSDALRFSYETRIENRTKTKNLKNDNKKDVVDVAGKTAIVSRKKSAAGRKV